MICGFRDLTLKTATFIIIHAAYRGNSKTMPAVEAHPSAIISSSMPHIRFLSAFMLMAEEPRSSGSVSNEHQL